MMNTDGTVPGNLPNVSKTYCASRATQVVPPHGASREAPGAAPEQRFHLREFLEFPQHADVGTGLLNAHLAPS